MKIKSLLGRLYINILIENVPVTSGPKQFQKGLIISNLNYYTFFLRPSINNLKKKN